MNYLTGTAASGMIASDKAPSTLTDDLSMLATRLADVRGRLSKLGDAMHGPIPRDATPEKATGDHGQLPSLRSAIDASFKYLMDIEGELSRVEARL